MTNKYFSKTTYFFLNSILVLNLFIFSQVTGKTETISAPPVRRALLISISEYNKLPTNKSFGALPSVPNDIKAMDALLRSPNYDFQVEKLENKEATRDNILAEIKSYLIEGAKEGDVSLLYFTGHGSQVINSLGGESDGKDETLVPFDVVRPVKKRSDLKDVRDKEINALLNQAVRAGINITAIIDSCHSGSIGRDDGEEFRQLEPADFDIKEKPTADQKEKATEKGALVISAAKDFQRASGAPYGHHPKIKDLGYQDTDTFGHLTANLLLALYTTPAELISAEDLFQRVAGRMRADALEQQPEIDATRERRRKTLFGTELNSEITRVPVEIGDDGKYYLLGGLAHGLSEGSELVRVNVSSDEETEVRIRIRLTNAQLTKSEFEIISENKTEKPNKGEFFKQVTWGASKEPYLTVWMPPSNLNTAQLKQIAGELTKLEKLNQIEIVESPEGTAPTHILYVDETGGKPGWQMSFPKGITEQLNEAPTADSLRKLLARHKTEGKTRLFANLPPPKELTAKLNYQTAGPRSPITAAPTRRGAIYRLAGRAITVDGKTELEYAWVLPSTFNEATEQNPKGESVLQTSLPPMTDWVNVADEKGAEKELNALALKLAKIRGWLNLSSGAESAKRYPYRLEFRTLEGCKIKENEPLVEGNEYRVFLTADPEILEANFNDLAFEFYVYVIAIDSNGASVLLHPKNSDAPKKIDSLKPPAPPEFDLTGKYPIYICDTEEEPEEGQPPCELGVENYVLLMTDKPLPSKDLLQFEGVRKETLSRKGDNPLEDLLLDIGTETTSRNGLSTPDNWFVQQVTRMSKEKN